MLHICPACTRFDYLLAIFILQESSKLCEKKDMILELFDRLLAKLGGEELSANITFGKISDEWSESMSSWLDSESKYRLTVEQVAT